MNPPRRLASRRTVLAGAAALPLTTRAWAQQPATAEPFGPAAIRHAIVHRVDKQKRGTGIVVSLRGPTGHSTIDYGSTRIGGPPADEQSIFPIASLTKIFTALLLADAAQQGRLSMGDPVARHLPGDIVVPEFQGRQITLADLATHTSGLPLRPPNLRSTDSQDPYAGYTAEALYAGISGIELTRAPGSEFEYSNFAYGLLGKAIEHRLGRSYGELVREKITGPLGMTETGLAPPAANDLRRVQGYDIDLKPVPPWDMAALVEAGGLFSTVTDLLSFLGLWVGTRKYPLTPAAYAMLAFDRPGDRAGVRMALGWRVQRAAGRTAVWSNGSAGGCRAFMGFCLEQRTGVVGFDNAQTAMGVDDIGLRVLGVPQRIDMSIPVPHHEIALARDRLERFAGLYAIADDDTVVIRLDGPTLVSQVGKQALPIYPESPTRFFFRAVDAQIEFLPGPDGQIAGLIWTQGGETWRYAKRP